MQTEETKLVRRLEAGQLYKLEHGYLLITEVGNSHVYYKMLRQPDQKAALTRMISIEGMLRFLQTEAVLTMQSCAPAEGNFPAGPSLSSGAERPIPAATCQENGLSLGLLGRNFQDSAVGLQPQIASALSCFCYHGVRQVQHLLGQARSPA